MKKKALKKYVKSFEVIIVNNYDPSIQLADTKGVTIEKLKREKRGLKFNVTVKVHLRKESEDRTICKKPYFTSSTITVLNEDEIPDKLDRAIEEILERIARWTSEGSGWNIEEVDNHYINVVSYVPFRGNSYISLPKELQNSLKGLINIKNEDNKCFQWCHIRHLNPVKYHAERITVRDIEFAER